MSRESEDYDRGRRWTRSCGNDFDYNAGMTGKSLPGGESDAFLAGAQDAREEPNPFRRRVSESYEPERRNNLNRSGGSCSSLTCETCTPERLKVLGVLGGLGLLIAGIHYDHVKTREREVTFVIDNPEYGKLNTIDLRYHDWSAPINARVPIGYQASLELWNVDDVELEVSFPNGAYWKSGGGIGRSESLNFKEDFSKVGAWNNPILVRSIEYPVRRANLRIRVKAIRQDIWDKRKLESGEMLWKGGITPLPESFK